MRMATVVLCGALAVVPALGVGTAHAGKSSMSSADKDFINRAALDNLTAIKLGQLAIDKGQTTAVKDFGRKLVDEHARAGVELKQLAIANNVTLPVEMSADAKNDYDKLAGLSGAEFDKAFMDYQVKDHQRVVADFERAAAKAKNPGLKSWVEQILPTLKQHEDLAKRDQKVM